MQNPLRIKGEEMSTLLSTKKIEFEDGAVQYFYEDGTTDYEVRGRKSPGTWFNEGDLYCSTWEPSTHVYRYHLEWNSEPETNKTIKFTHLADGETFVGKLM